MGCVPIPIVIENGQGEIVGHGEFKPHIDYLNIIDKEIIAIRIIRKLIKLGFLEERGLKSIQELAKLLIDEVY